MFAIIEGGVSVLKKKWKRLRHESRRPHFTFAPLSKNNAEPFDTAPPQRTTRAQDEQREVDNVNVHEFTIFSFLTKAHDIVLDSTLCVQARERIFEDKLDDGAVVGTSTSGQFVAWVSTAEERMYIGDLERLVVINRFPVPLRVQDEESSNLRETSYVSNVDDVYVSNDAKTVAVVYHFHEKTYVEAWNGKLWLRVITLPKGAECFLDLSKHLDLVVTQAHVRDEEANKVTLAITDKRYDVTSSASKCEVLESISLRCRDIGPAAEHAGNQVVAFMANNYEQRALGVNATRDPKILFYRRSTEHIFEYNLRSGIGIRDGVVIHAMAWTCDGLFLSVALSDGTLVVVTNCGEPVQLYVKGNLGPSLERKRIEEFKVDCPRMYNIPRNKLVKQNMLRGHWTTVAHPGLPLFLITNGCVMMMIKLPTFSLYNASMQDGALTHSYNAAIKALTYGVDSDDVLEDECHGLELIRKEDFIRHAFHAWTLLLNYPYEWSAIFHNTCTKLLRHLSVKALSRGRENMDVLRIASQLLFVYERDQRVGNLLVNELACFARLLVTALAEEKRFYEAAHVLRLFENSGIRFDRLWMALAGQAWEQRDLNVSELDPVLSDQIRQNVADPILAIAYDRVEEWSRRLEREIPKGSDTEERHEVNADAIIHFLKYLRLPEDKDEEKAQALSKAGALPYMCHLLQSYELETAVRSAVDWASKGELNGDVTKALKLLVKVIFCHFVESTDGIYVPHPITCYEQPTSCSKRLQLKELSEASAGVELWSLETAFQLGARVLDSSSLYDMLMKVGDTLLVTAVLQQVIHMFGPNDVYQILRRQFCLSVLRKDLSGMSALLDLIQRTELEENANFSWLWFILQYLKRNKTSLKPLSSKGIGASLESTVLCIFLAILRKQSTHTIQREQITGCAEVDANRWVVLCQHAMSLMWALALNKEEGIDGHVEGSGLRSAIVSWVETTDQASTHVSFSEEVEVSFSGLVQGQAKLITGITKAIQQRDPERFGLVMDLVFDAVKISKKSLVVQDNSLVTLETTVQAVHLDSRNEAPVENESARIQKEEMKPLLPVYEASTDVTPVPDKILARVGVKCEDESAPDWHIMLSDQETVGAHPPQQANSDALDLLLQTQQHILNRLDQLDYKRAQTKEEPTEPSETSSSASDRVSDISELVSTRAQASLNSILTFGKEKDDEEEPYSAAARMFNRKVMSSLRWRKLPEQRATPICAEDNNEIRVAQNVSATPQELIRTQTTIRSLYTSSSSTKELVLAHVRKPRRMQTIGVSSTEEAPEASTGVEATTQTVVEESRKENDVGSSNTSSPVISQQDKDPIVERRDVGIVVNLYEREDMRTEQGTQCGDIRNDISPDVGTPSLSRKPVGSCINRSEAHEEARVEAPVFVRYKETPSGATVLRNFSSPSVALNLGTDNPSGLVHIAGEGRQFLHVVDLDESDLL